MFPCSCTQLEHKLVQTFSFCGSLLWASRAEFTENIGILAYHVGIYRARISLNRTFISGYINSNVVINSIPNLPYNMKPSSLLYNFILLVKIGFRGDSPDLLRSHTFHNARPIVICQCTLKSVRKVKFVSMNSVRIVDLVVVNVEFCIRKMECKNLSTWVMWGTPSPSSINSASSSPVSVKTVYSLHSLSNSVVL